MVLWYGAVGIRCIDFIEAYSEEKDNDLTREEPETRSDFLACIDIILYNSIES